MRCNCQQRERSHSKELKLTNDQKTNELKIYGIISQVQRSK